MTKENQYLTQVLSKYDEKLGEVTKIKESAMEKELLLKDSETRVSIKST